MCAQIHKEVFFAALTTCRFNILVSALLCFKSRHSSVQHWSRSGQNQILQTRD